MIKPHEEQVCLKAPPLYHCYVRCVRRALLCDDGFSTGENYDHRKQWIVSRLKFLSWSDKKVVERWLQEASVVNLSILFL